MTGVASWWCLLSWIARVGSSWAVAGALMALGRPRRDFGGAGYGAATLAAASPGLAGPRRSISRRIWRNLCPLDHRRLTLPYQMDDKLDPRRVLSSICIAFQVHENDNRDKFFRISNQMGDKTTRPVLLSPIWYHVGPARASSAQLGSLLAVAGGWPWREAGRGGRLAVAGGWRGGGCRWWVAGSGPPGW